MKIIQNILNNNLKKKFLAALEFRKPF